jgi:hypothetical protein
LVTCLATLLPVSTSFAIPLTTPTETTTYTTTSTESATTKGVDNGYGGLKWTFGEGWIPEIVVGYRHAEVSTNGNTQGADASIAFKVNPALPLNEMIQPGKLRVKYFNGMDYLQGEVGGGYDFAKKSVFAGIGAQGPYANAGVDYNFSEKSSFSTFLMFNSLGIYNRPHNTTITTTPTTTLSCPSGFLLVGNGCESLIQ